MPLMVMRAMPQPPVDCRFHAEMREARVQAPRLKIEKMIHNPRWLCNMIGQGERAGMPFPRSPAHAAGPNARDFAERDVMEYRQRIGLTLVCHLFHFCLRHGRIPLARYDSCLASHSVSTTVRWSRDAI